MSGAIIMFVVCVLCGGAFLAIGQWAKHRKEPMHFYSGTTVSPEEIRDVSAYNRANARLWSLYSLPYFAAGILGFWNVGLSAILIGISCIPGMFLLIFGYHRVYRKYAVKK